MTVYDKGTRKCHRLLDRHWNCFRGSVSETCEGRDVACVGCLLGLTTDLDFVQLSVAGCYLLLLPDHRPTVQLQASTSGLLLGPHADGKKGTQ